MAASRSVSGSSNRAVWVTGGESVTLDRGAGNLQFSLVPTLLFLVIISQVGIENPIDLINLQISRGRWYVGTGEFSSTAFGIFDRVGIAGGTSTGLSLYLRAYLLSSVQIMISRVSLVRVQVSSWSTTSGSTPCGAFY